MISFDRNEMVCGKFKFLGIINLTGTDTLSKVTPEDKEKK